MVSLGSNPYTFSIKDFIAVFLITVDLVLVCLRFFGFGTMEVINYLSPFMMVVLTGYFVHEVSMLAKDAYSIKVNDSKQADN